MDEEQPIYDTRALLTKLQESINSGFKQAVYRNEIIVIEYEANKSDEVTHLTLGKKDFCLMVRTNPKLGRELLCYVADLSEEPPLSEVLNPVEAMVKLGLSIDPSMLPNKAQGIHEANIRFENVLGYASAIWIAPTFEVALEEIRTKGNLVFAQVDEVSEVAKISGEKAKTAGGSLFGNLAKIVMDFFRGLGK